MALGPGKYDALCTEIREKAKALGCIIAIYGGEHGNGFSAQLPYELTMQIPTVLRQMADEIEKSGPFNPEL